MNISTFLSNRTKKKLPNTCDYCGSPVTATDAIIIQTKRKSLIMYHDKCIWKAAVKFTTPKEEES